MKIEIDDDFLDHLVGETIVTSYLNIRDDLKKASKKPGAYTQEDVDYWEELLPALELVGGWFVYNFEQKTKAKKK
jgi:hypothetical protein